MLPLPITDIKSRIQWLDSLRGIAILLVILFHFTTRYQDKYPTHLFAEQSLFQVRFGWTGVYLFFMISGFIIYHTIQKKNGFWDFMVARLSRLMPPYWASIIIILILDQFHPSVFHESVKNNIPTIVANVFMVPDIFKMRFLDGAFWSLYVEIKFYIFIAVLWQLVDMRKPLAYYLSYILLFLGSLIHNYVYHFSLGDTVSYFLIFWTGIAACKLLTEQMTVWEYAIITTLTTVSTAGYYTEGLELFIGIPIFAFMFLAGHALFNKYNMLTILAAPVSIMGRFSYSLYLIHQSIGYLLLGILASEAINHTISVFLGIITCSSIAILGFIFVERLDKPIAAYIMNKKNTAVQLKTTVT